jgi:hypothetical protein
MLNPPSISPRAVRPYPPAGLADAAVFGGIQLLERLQAGDRTHRPCRSRGRPARADEESPVEWSEEDVVFLHWRLLQESRPAGRPRDAAGREVRHPALGLHRAREGPQAVLVRESCLRVVGCSPLSPIAYCGLVDAEDVRDFIRHGLKAWLAADADALSLLGARGRRTNTRNGSRRGWPATRSGSTKQVRRIAVARRPVRLIHPHDTPYVAFFANALRPAPIQGVVMTAFKDVLCLAGDLPRLRHRRTPGL